MGFLSERFFDAPGADATGTNAYASCLAIHQSTDILKVGLENSFGYPVGMADLVANHLCFSTHRA